MTRFDTSTKDASLQTKQSFLSRMFPFVSRCVDYESRCHQPSYSQRFCVGEILELAVLLSVKSKDEKAFERYFSQLKSYYFDLQYVRKSPFQR
jgi:hypothetical protein